MRGYRTQQVYIDEDGILWRREQWKDLVKPFSINSTINSRARQGDIDNAYYESSKWKTLFEAKLTTKTNTEPKDVNPEEFEKILNGS